MRNMFVAAVVVLMFAACAKKAEETQVESAAPIQADTTAVSDGTVKPITEGEAAK